MMDIFIGCSSQGAQDLADVTALIAEANVTPVPWSNPEVFDLSKGTWEALLQLAKTVEAAVFIFREDDEINRANRVVTTTRDNVILEFGLFTGTLPPGRCAIARKGEPWFPADLHGVTYIPLDSRDAARQKIRFWVSSMMNERRVWDKEHPNLKEKQIAAISTAMLDTGIAMQQVYVLFERLGVPKAHVDYCRGLRD
jgi:predicted nucleotide-binding protein